MPPPHPTPTLLVNGSRVSSCVYDRSPQTRLQQIVHFLQYAKPPGPMKSIPTCLRVPQEAAKPDQDHHIAFLSAIVSGNLCSAMHRLRHMKVLRSQWKQLRKLHSYDIETKREYYTVRHVRPYPRGMTILRLALAFTLTPRKLRKARMGCGGTRLRSWYTSSNRRNLNTLRSRPIWHVYGPECLGDLSSMT